MATPAMKRYAAEIYRLQEDHPFVGLSDLSQVADVSVQAATRMVGKMKELGYLDHEPYRGVTLTEAGEEIAMPALRRHRLVEVFLVEVMDFDWDEAHDLSDQLELGINETLEDRIDVITGHPTRCPHGEPIPSREGVMPEIEDTSLVELEPPLRCRVSRVRTHDPEKLSYIKKLGLVPGVTFEIVSRAPFEGPIRVRLDREETVLGYDLAASLYVTPLLSGATKK